MTPLSFSVYFLVMLMLLFGMKVAKGKNNFHEDFMSPQKTKSTRGIAAALILLHHISQQQPFIDASEVQVFRRLGPVFVLVFFFFSGYGLVRNYDKKKDYLNGFFSKRIGKQVLLPFYINVIIYFILLSLMGFRFSPIELIFKFVGLSLMNSYAWFPIVLFTLYLSFFLSFKYIKNNKLAFLVVLLVILSEGLFFCHWGHFAWWGSSKPNWWMAPNGFGNKPWWMQDRVLIFSGEWWVNSSIGFFLGMLFSRFESKIMSFLKKKYWLKLIISVILLLGFQLLTAYCQRRYGFWSEYSGNGPMIGAKIICYLSQLPQMTAFLLVILLIRMKINTSNPVTRFFGKYSLHTYLMNFIPIYYFSYLIFRNRLTYIKPFSTNLALYAALVIIATVILAIAEERICYGVTRLIDHISSRRNKAIINTKEGEKA